MILYQEIICNRLKITKALGFTHLTFQSMDVGLL